MTREDFIGEVDMVLAQLRRVIVRAFDDQPHIVPAAPSPPDPPSLAKIEANRRNALLSTGPRTEAGKKQSSRNALKHKLLRGVIESNGISVDLFENTVTFAGKTETATLRQAQLIAAVVQAMPNVIPRITAMQTAWPDAAVVQAMPNVIPRITAMQTAWPDLAESSRNVLIYEAIRGAQTVLANVGLTMTSVPRVGLSIVLPGPA